MITHHNIIPVYCARQINSIFSFGQNRTVPGANNVISKSKVQSYNKNRINDDRVVCPPKGASEYIERYGG